MAKQSIFAYLGINTDDFQKGMGKAKKQMTGFEKAGASFANNITGLFAGAFALSSITSFGKSVIDITGQFQRLEAVLTNSLGSTSAAQESLRMIKDFAAKTPFAVNDLTESFVKLANQGFKPTADEMTKLGDLASSTGKGFDQLTEAIIDAQTGEFERLKEFGIRAEKQGDKVTFAFKGVKTQTDFTTDSIRQYILSLGDLEGVSGSMAAISETLEGKISNLGDSWDSMLNTIGGSTSGVMTGVIDTLNDAIAGIEHLVKTADQIRMESLQKGFDSLKESAGGMANELVAQFKEAGLKGKELESAIKNAVKSSSEFGKQAKERGDKNLAIQYFNEAIALKEILIQTQKTTTAQKELTKEQQKAIEAQKKLNELREGLDMSVSGVKTKGLTLKDNESPMMQLQEGIKPLPSLFDNAMASLEQRIARTTQRMQESANAINGAFASIATGGLATLGTALGTAFAGGDLASIGAEFSSMLAGVITSLGTKLIEIGVVMSGIMEALMTGGFANPALLIGGGVALVALGAAMKNMMGSPVGFADGGLVTGSVFANIGEGIGTNSANPEVIAPLDKLKNFINPSGGGMGGGDVKFRIEGNTLVGILDRQNKTSKYSR
jgi:hypothetical protein